MNELAADGIPAAVLCRVLGLPRQLYYRLSPDRAAVHYIPWGRRGRIRRGRGSIADNRRTDLVADAIDCAHIRGGDVSAVALHSESWLTVRYSGFRRFMSSSWHQAEPRTD